MLGKEQYIFGVDKDFVVDIRANCLSFAHPPLALLEFVEPPANAPGREQVLDLAGKLIARGVEDNRVMRDCALGIKEPTQECRSHLSRFTVDAWLNIAVP